MVMIHHPLSGTEYRLNDDGTVNVVKKSTGVGGTFDRAGMWLHGERRTADPALCMWVADGDAVTPVHPEPDEAHPDPDLQPPQAVFTELATERSFQ